MRRVISETTAEDVLYAMFEGATVKVSRESENDSYLILNLDETGQVVGVQVLYASALLPHTWPTHPDRQQVPEPIRAELDLFIHKP